MYLENQKSVINLFSSSTRIASHFHNYHEWFPMWGEGQIYKNQHISSIYTDKDRVNDASEKSHMQTLKTVVSLSRWSWPGKWGQGHVYVGAQVFHKISLNSSNSFITRNSPS